MARASMQSSNFQRRSFSALAENSLSPLGSFASPNYAVPDVMSSCGAPKTALVSPIRDEDCLYLNVVTPKEGSELPVMVWIHGGGFVLGEGVQTDGGTSGTKLAETENLVVVSMNYRLGPFGFLAHAALTAESEQNASGNYGLMDQVAALRWVRENIRAFGGDPDNITIFGESAGAFSTCGLVTSPRAAGLFHRGIMQSGSCERPWPTLEAGHAKGERFAELVGCDTETDALSCMRGKPWEELHEAWAPDPADTGLIGYEASLIDVEGKYLQWTPILDGYFFEDQSALRTANGTFNQVPLMIGFTREEGRSLSPLGSFASPNYAVPDVMSSCGAPKTALVSPIRLSASAPSRSSRLTSRDGQRFEERQHVVDARVSWSAVRTGADRLRPGVDSPAVPGGLPSFQPGNPGRFVWVGG